MNAATATESSSLATQSVLRELRSTAAVRKRAHALLVGARAGLSAAFTVGDDATIAAAAALVAQVTHDRYGGGPIPYHSRWRHFEAGGVDRRGELDRLLGNVSAAERARTQIDLTVVSVLLDAGAGPDWLFLPVPDDKVVKNRIHFDFTPDDQAAEVERVIALGARRVDIGQGEQSWVVLADPEGNEFCILAAE